MRRLRSSLFTLAMIGTAVLGCERRKTHAPGFAAWIDAPTPGTRSGDVITLASLGIQFEVPDTLYVFKKCSEASHVPDAGQAWIPVIRCESVRAGEFDSQLEAFDDLALAPESVDEASRPEPISMTIYATKKTRAIDERSVTWFENKYRDAGFEVDEIVYQGNYQRKSGIYTVLHELDPQTKVPVRETLQFLFSHKDVVFIARTEYPYGDTRAINKDWDYILWNFELSDAPSEE